LAAAVNEGAGSFDPNKRMLITRRKAFPAND